MYKLDAIVTTVSLQMGLDVSSIKGIVHYNFPHYLENYIQ